MKKIINLNIYFTLLLLLSGCGTKEFLGFEKKKIKLEGARVALLEQVPDNFKDEKVFTKIIFLEQM